MKKPETLAEYTCGLYANREEWRAYAAFLEAKCAWQAEMLERANELIEAYGNRRTDDGCDVPRWIADLAKGPKT